MIRRLLWALGCVCCVAVAAAPLPVRAEEWIGSESDSIGSFGVNDTTPEDNFNDLVDDLDEVIDLEDTNQDPEEDNTDNIDRDSEVTDEDLIKDLFDQYVQDMEYNDSVHDLQSLDNAEGDDIDNIEPYANYDTYYGAIGSTYLEYMRGFLPKLGFRDHYVCARVSQYTYIFAYGALEFTGSLFRGSDITVITFNTNNNGSYSAGVQSSFNLDPDVYMVYSDLSDIYPSLADTSGVSSRQILILLTIMGLVWTIDHMYQVRKIRRIK